MTTLPSGLPVVVQRADPVPLAVQISAQLEAAVTGGVLHAGDRRRVLPQGRQGRLLQGQGLLQRQGLLRPRRGPRREALLHPGH